MNKQGHKQVEAIRSIQKKLLGRRLNYKEIYHVMDEIAQEKLSDVLTTYFVAASFKEGFNGEELYFLTKAMVETGNQMHFEGIVADKHSTGGIAGTRTTLIVVPIIAAAGFKIPKISSRAITTPAGTADVMETVAKVEFDIKEVEKIVNQVGGCIVWNGKLGIAPADDVIIRVEEPLSFESFDKIIVSVISKKIAAGTNHLILDIPYGKTGKIHHRTDAEKIAAKFKFLAEKFHIKLVADTDQIFEPAGYGIGPALELKDSLLVLEQSPKRPIKLEEKALRLAGELLDICFKTAKKNKNGLIEAKNILESGLALKKFQEIVLAQNGMKQIFSGKIKMQSHVIEAEAKNSFKIKEINNFNLNTVAKILGAPEDKYAGIYLRHKIGDKLSKGEISLFLYSNSKHKLKEAKETLENFPIYY